MAIDAATARRVRERAGQRCEYCGLPQSCSRFALPIDHVIALKHGGADDDGNLALSCALCNGYKGSDIASRLPDGPLVRLFHPREDSWREHFRWDGCILVGLTDVGRVTVALLRINDVDAVALRRALRQTP